MSVREASAFKQHIRNQQMEEELEALNLDCDKRLAELKKAEVAIEERELDLAIAQQEIKDAQKKLQLDREVLEGAKSDLKLKKKRFNDEVKRRDHLMRDAELIDVGGFPKGDKGMRQGERSKSMIASWVFGKAKEEHGKQEKGGKKEGAKKAASEGDEADDEGSEDDDELVILSPNSMNLYMAG